MYMYMYCHLLLIAHTNTHTLTHSHTHSLTHTLTHTHSLTHSLTHTLTHTHSLTHSLTHTDHREPILHELIKTERRYISNLDTLLNTLLPAIEDAVAPRDLRLLFPCQLEPLLEWHKQLLTQLEDQMESDYGMVGDVFRQICSGEAGNVRMCAYRSLFTVASVITIVIKIPTRV